MTTSLTRRSFLAMAGAAPFAASAALQAAQTKKIPVGIELYSVRGELGKDLNATVTAVAKMGYQVVEFYSPYMNWTPEQAKDVRKLLDDLGIKCLSTHNGVQSLTSNLQQAIDLNGTIGSKAIIIASAPPKLQGVDGWKSFADTLTAGAEKLRAAGMVTGFHNHQTEWQPAAEGSTERAMDVIAKNTPKDVVLQLDCGTCVEAGQDPVAWIKANPGRIRSLHLKDWGAGDRGYNVAFGEGDVQWKPLLDAAESVGGAEYYLIEQERAGTLGEIAMAQKCLDNYKKLRS